MKALRRAWNRVAGSLFGKGRETELNDEFEFHIQMLTEENLRRGSHPSRRVVLPLSRSAAWRRQKRVTAISEARRSSMSYGRTSGMLWQLSAWLRDCRWRSHPRVWRPAFCSASVLMMA